MGENSYHERCSETPLPEEEVAIGKIVEIQDGLNGIAEEEWGEAHTQSVQLR